MILTPPQRRLNAWIAQSTVVTILVRRALFEKTFCIQLVEKGFGPTTDISPNRTLKN